MNAAAQYLAYGIAHAEGRPEEVAKKHFRAARDAMLTGRHWWPVVSTIRP